MKSKNTLPEIKFRKVLYSKGYRFKIHFNKLPGKPDIVLHKYKTIINIHGCFWHNHGCSKSNLPRTQTVYWHKALENNKVRDFINKKRLIELGWKVLDVWECTLNKKNINKTFEKISRLMII
jgi:DNA mismatch endonuclease (patch repair protein)